MASAEIINISTLLCAAIITMVLIFASAFGTDLKQPVHRWYFVILLLNMLSITAEYMVWLLSGHAGPAVSVTIRIIDCLSYVIPGCELLVFMIYLYYYFNTKIKTQKTAVYLVAFFSITTVLLAIIAQFNEMYSYFDAGNNYHMLNGYWIWQIFPVLSFFVFICFTLKYVRFLRPSEYITLLLYSVVPLACYAVEGAAPGIWVAHLGAAITLFLVYLNIGLGMKNQLLIKEAELAESRNAVMLSQINPHFLYNSLSAISSLCDGNPEANKALIVFSEYLRVNMDSLTQKDLIPFEKELEHVKQYLWLEQLRFEERLRVIYDIRARDFMMPVLTLQPVVENAVMHGILKKRSGGTVTVKTEEEERFYRITVEDDGVGFDPSAALTDDRAHIGISNVKERLAAMCGGSLAVESAPGRGTAAIIKIPKRGAEK